MNHATSRKLFFAVSVSAGMALVTQLAHAQSAQPGPYALPPYMQNVQQDRADVRQDTAEIRGDEKAIAGDRGTLRTAESQRSTDLAKLRADRRAGNTGALSADRAALAKDDSGIRQDRRSLGRDERELHADRAERRHDERQMHRDEHRTREARWEHHEQRQAHATRVANRSTH